MNMAYINMWIFLNILISLHCLTKACTPSYKYSTQITAFSGESVLLPCSCTDPQDKPDSVFWESNSKRASKDRIYTDMFSVFERYYGRITLFNQTSPGNVSLLLSDLTKDDQGSYVCLLEKTSRFFNVTIEERRETNTSFKPSLSCVLISLLFLVLAAGGAAVIYCIYRARRKARTRTGEINGENNLYAFQGGINDRKHPEVNHDGHISIEDLRIALKDDTNVMQIRHDFERLGRHYELKIMNHLTNNIPNYPTPIEFHISEVTHVTNNDDLPKIMESRGFKAHEKFSWWSLKIDKESIRAAEERYLEKVFPNRSQEQKQRQEPFLCKFTVSPAFHIDKSRYGNFRFIFPLKELMETYKEQMCGGQDPILREYKTVFYKQEIMYVVLIHSPKDNGSFENFQKIEKSSFVDYEENQIVWKAQAIGDAIRFNLVLNTEDRIAEVAPVLDRYYVWDHVSLAFHFDDVLQFPLETLQKSTTCCKLDKIKLAKGRTCSSLEEAEEIL